MSDSLTNSFKSVGKPGCDCILDFYWSKHKYKRHIRAAHLRKDQFHWFDVPGSDLVIILIRKSSDDSDD